MTVADEAKVMQSYTALRAYTGRAAGVRLTAIGIAGHFQRDRDRHDQRLLRHERKHLEQIECDGRLLFSIKYLYWLCRYGYKMCPYEVEARAAESKTT